MSNFANYGSKEAARMYDSERFPSGADIIAGLLHIHCGKRLEDIHVLDAGCGTGHYAKALIDLGVGCLTLMDANADMLDVAREKLVEFAKDRRIDRTVEAILPEMPFEDATFDAVMFNSVLHHLDRAGDNNNFPVLGKTLMETKRVLRPSGVIVVSTATPIILKESAWFTQLHSGLLNKIMKAVPSNRQYLDLFAKHGFRCVSEMNLLTGATPSLFTNYLDSDGPIKTAWRTDHVISQSRQTISETYRRPRKAKHEKEKQSEHSLAWFERCNIGVEFWGTAAKRLLPKKSAPATGCKYVIICRITMEKKQLAQGTIVTKKESKLNCVLRMPELEWGAAIVKLQLPKLLPLNLWPGETYVFGFLQSDNQATSNVTLVGKVGNEDVRITQPVIHNPNFSTERWKQLGDILTAEMNKHKKILSKEISKCDVKQKHSRDTGYNTTSQRYSSDASQKAHSHRKEESTDSDDNTWIDSETRRSRRNDAAHSSPTNRPVQTSYKRKVEESKVVEETESRSKSTDDSKSQSSGEKQFVTEEQLDTKETPFKQASANKTVQQTATPLLHTAEANYFGSDKKYSFDSQKSVAKTDKKRSSIAKRSSFPLTLTEASKPLEKPNLKKENCARAQETETEGWLDDRDADDESDEIIETPSGSPEKGDTLALSDCIVRPKTPVPLDQGDEARGNDKANKVKANNDKAPNTKRISISEIMEKQEMQSPIKSPQQKLNEDVLPLKINNEDSLIRVLSPKAQYFAMHHYGNITSSNSVESPSADQEGRSFHNVDICCEDAKVMCNVNDNTGASGTSSQLNTTERDSRNNPSAKDL